MKLYLSWFAGFAVCSVTACTQSDVAIQAVESNPLGDATIATINGQPVADSVFKVLTLAALQRDPSTLSDNEREQMIEQIVIIQLLADAAESNGLSSQTEIAAELEFQRLQALARRMTEKFRNDNAPSEPELRQAYEENLPQYLSTQYKARHILTESEADAADLIGQLDEGADFSALAQEHSTGPTGPRGGDLGWFTADTMVAPFSEAVRGAEIGSYSPQPVQTQFGWHVILVEDVREQQPPGLEAVRSELLTAVEREKLDAYITSLRESAIILVSEPVD